MQQLAMEASGVDPATLATRDADRALREAQVKYSLRFCLMLWFFWLAKVSQRNWANDDVEEIIGGHLPSTVHKIP